MTLHKHTHIYHTFYYTRQVKYNIICYYHTTLNVSAPLNCEPFPWGTTAQKLLTVKFRNLRTYNKLF